MQPDVREHIAAEVRAELARQSKSQRDLAEALDLPQSAIWQRLRGNRSFRAEELAAVAEYLDVPMASFLPADVTAEVSGRVA